MKPEEIIRRMTPDQRATGILVPHGTYPYVRPLPTEESRIDLTGVLTSETQ